jgi:hypothetical protein
LHFARHGKPPPESTNREDVLLLGFLYVGGLVTVLLASTASPWAAVAFAAAFLAVLLYAWATK